jgi:TPR repeat protein
MAAGRRVPYSALRRKKEWCGSEIEAILKGMRAAFALIGLLVAGCGGLGATKQGALPADVHAKPDARELEEHPCRYGDAVRCIARCEGGDAQGCNGAGVLFEFGERPDPLLASSFYGRACDANYGPGCDNLGWLYLRGHGVPRDPPHAMVLFMAAFDAASLACARGDGAGCLLAGELLRDGRGVEQDDAQALAMFQRACSYGEAEGCER